MEPRAGPGGLASWLREHWREVAIGAAVLVVLGVLNRLLPSIDVESALHKISSTLGGFAYALAGAAAFLETGAFVGLVLPGETFVILAGAVAGQGAGSRCIAGRGSASPLSGSRRWSATSSATAGARS